MHSWGRSRAWRIPSGSRVIRLCCGAMCGPSTSSFAGTSCSSARTLDSERSRGSACEDAPAGRVFARRLLQGGSCGEVSAGMTVGESPSKNRQRPQRSRLNTIGARFKIGPFSLMRKICYASALFAGKTSAITSSQIAFANDLAISLFKKGDFGSRFANDFSGR